MREIKEIIIGIIWKTFFYAFCIVFGMFGFVASIGLVENGARATGIIIGIVACLFFFHPLLKWALNDLEKFDDRMMSGFIFIGFVIMLRFIYYEIWLSSSLRVFHILILGFIIFLFLLFKLSGVKGWYNSLIIIRPLIIVVGIAYSLFLFYFPSFFGFVFYERDAQWPVLCFAAYVIIQLIRYKKDLLMEIRHLHFLNIDASVSYILYLRSFDSDKEHKIHLREIENFADSKRVYAIGNPKTLKQSLNSNFHIFYLPNTNWQEAVDNLSEKAEYIFINVGITEGILWEIASHQKWSKKTIYCADNYQQLITFLNMAKGTEILSKIFVSSIENAYKIHALSSKKESSINTIVEELQRLGLLKNMDEKLSLQKRLINALFSIVGSIVKYDMTNGYNTSKDNNSHEKNIKGVLYSLIDREIIPKTTDSELSIKTIICELINLGLIESEDTKTTFWEVIKKITSNNAFHSTADFDNSPSTIKEGQSIYYQVVDGVCTVMDSKQVNELILHNK